MITVFPYSPVRPAPPVARQQQLPPAVLRTGALGHHDNETPTPLTLTCQILHLATSHRPRPELLSYWANPPPPVHQVPHTHHHRLQLPPSERRSSLFTFSWGILWTETASVLAGGWLVSALMNLCVCRSQQSESSSSGVQSHHAGDVSYGIWWVHLRRPTD